MTIQTKVAVLGLGPMGRALAGAFLAAGHAVTVWNRSPERTKPLAERGAAVGATPAEAVAGADLTVICVLDYDAADTILAAAGPALAGRTVVNLTADTPARARRTAAWAEREGVDYLDGTILSPAATIGGAEAVLLFSGPRDRYEAHRDTLAALGGSQTYVGADPGRAAAYDVALLDMFWTGYAGMAHGFALGRAEGVDPTDLAPYAQGIVNLLPQFAPTLAEAVQADDHGERGSNLRSAAAGVRHVLHAARDRGLATGSLAAITEIAERGVADGFGDDDPSRLADLFRTPLPGEQIQPPEQPREDPAQGEPAGADSH